MDVLLLTGLVPNHRESVPKGRGIIAKRVKWRI